MPVFFGLLVSLVHSVSLAARIPGWATWRVLRSLLGKIVRPSYLPSALPLPACYHASTKCMAGFILGLSIVATRTLSTLKNLVDAKILGINRVDLIIIHSSITITPWQAQSDKQSLHQNRLPLDAF